jgi:hypothetical protein
VFVEEETKSRVIKSKPAFASRRPAVLVAPTEIKKAAGVKRTSRQEIDSDEQDDASSEEEDVEKPSKKRQRTEVVEEELAKDAGWQDLDAGDEEDPLMVTEYVLEVYEYLREVEVGFLCAR